MNILARLRPLCLLLLVPLLLTACVDSDELPDDARGNFEALWRIIDEHYCFFDYKREQYGLDWNEVYQRYSRQMNDKMTEAQMFEVLTNMLAELRDGHVNLYTAFDVGRYWSWHEDFPRNFSDDLLDRYLGTDYRIVGSLRYRVLPDNTGYIYCGSFQNEFGAGNLDEVLYYLSPCNALIIDVRNNGGGKLTAAEQLAGRFTNEELLVGYMSHKTGKGHNDFSAPEEQKLAPSKGIRWQKPVAVLTNRSVYSAANEFVKYMKCCPRVTVIGVVSSYPPQCVPEDSGSKQNCPSMTPSKRAAFVLPATFPYDPSALLSTTSAPSASLTASVLRFVVARPV